MIHYLIKVGSDEEKDILTEYGVHVSGSTGLVGKPEYKESRKYSWDYLNGEWVDLGERRYKPREITMKCWISAKSTKNAESAAVAMLNSFLSVFDTDKLVRLRIMFNTGGLSNGLFYLVYLRGSSPKYKWNKRHQVIEFELRLTEPSPEKKIFQRSYTGSGLTAIATYTSSSEFEIDWGDGSVSYDLVGSNKTVSHTYASEGTYFIIASGVLKDIDVTITSSNAQPSGSEVNEEEELER